MSTFELHDRLVQLEAERAFALATSAAEIDAYMADLEEETEHCRHLYAVSAVTEIVTLRAELSGPQIG